MEQKNRRGGDPDGFTVLLGGERLEPTENTLEKQFPILWKHWVRDPEMAVAA